MSIQRGNESSDETAGPFGADEERTMPLSFEDGGESLSVAGGGSRRRFGFGTLIFAGAAAIAVASLFSMRAIGRAGATELANSDAGMLVETFLKERANRKADESKKDGLLDADGYAQLQIARDDLQKNPFVLTGEQPRVEGIVASDGGGGAVVEPAQDPNAARIAEWEEAVAASLENVRVVSTMLSSRPDAGMANVNGAVYRTGDAVLVPKATVRLTIHKIEADGVTLRAFDASLGRERLQKVLVKRAF